MPRPNTPDPINESLMAPSYEAEIRAMANWLERKADGLSDFPVPIVVQISPECARWIATVLHTHANNVELQHG